MRHLKLKNIYPLPSEDQRVRAQITFQYRTAARRIGWFGAAAIRPLLTWKSGTKIRCVLLLRSVPPPLPLTKLPEASPDLSGGGRGSEASVEQQFRVLVQVGKRLEALKVRVYVQPAHLGSAWRPSC